MSCRVDNFVLLHTNNKTHEWKRLKQEIERLNLESNDESSVVRCITLKVTIKNRVLQGEQYDRVNELAAMINETRGKSSKR